MGCENSEWHQAGGDADCRFARGVDAEATRDESSGKPAAEEASDCRSEIRNPCGGADIFEAEVANFFEIRRQPEHVEPPDGIDQKAREQDAPGLPESKQSGERGSGA